MNSAGSGTAVRRHCRANVMVVLVLGMWTAGTARAADIYKGAKVYQVNCQTCHGTDGRGLMPQTPDFTHGAGLVQSDRVLLEAVRSGNTRRGGIHPAYRGILDEREMLDVIAYLRTLLK